MLGPTLPLIQTRAKQVRDVTDADQAVTKAFITTYTGCAGAVVTTSRSNARLAEMTLHEHRPLSMVVIIIRGSVTRSDYRIVILIMYVYRSMYSRSLSKPSACFIMLYRGMDILI